MKCVLFNKLVPTYSSATRDERAPGASQISGSPILDFCFKKCHGAITTIRGARGLPPWSLQRPPKKYVRMPKNFDFGIPNCTYALYQVY